MTEDEYKAILAGHVLVAATAVWNVANMTRGRETWFNRHFANALIRALRATWHEQHTRSTGDS